MRFTATILLGIFLSIPAFSQMSAQQKANDFQQLVALYDKDYSFYEWKRDAIGFDLLKIQPWLERISQTTDDLSYYEIAQQYVASLKDGHDLYLNPSDFSADLRFAVDLYDGKARVDAIDRTALPLRKYNIQVGDELVSIDGKTPQDFIADYSKFYSDGTLRSTQRDTVGFAPYRPQALNPRAANVGDSAAVVLLGPDGAMKNLTIPWVKNGTWFTSIGPVPTPNVRRATARSVPNSRPHPHPVFGSRSGPISSDAQKFYRSLTARFQHQRKPNAIQRDTFNGLGSLDPIYQGGLPTDFQQRLGFGGDYFFSGTYTSGNYTIGLIRIPDFEASSSNPSFNDLENAVAQFQDEIAFMKTHTDGLIVDVTNNPGGFGFYALQLLDRLTTQRYRQAGYTVRPQYADITGLNQLLATAEYYGLEQWQINIVGAYRDQLQAAYQSNRGMTGPLPIDFGWSLDPNDLSSLSFEHYAIVDSKGKPVGYDKPVLCLADDSSFSAAELFAASFQDSKRGPVAGFVTGGLGGGREDTLTGVYSEASTSVTVTRLLRSQPVSNPDYPAAPYIENIGVRPDITLDYMTVDNLTSGGTAYVAGYTQALLALLPAK